MISLALLLTILSVAIIYSSVLCRLSRIEKHLGLEPKETRPTPPQPE